LPVLSVSILRIGEMKVSRGDLAGVVLIEPRVFGDARGWFLETWNQQRYLDAGLAESFVQDNLSFSRRGSLRGLHFQNPCPQGKLVSVLDGAVFDVVVDIRRGSPTFGHWRGVTLTGETKQQLYVPTGFAHGFLTLTDTALFHYKCTAPYSPKDELAVRWNDPDLGIAWPMPDPILSSKDAAAPLLREIPEPRLFTWDNA
jgi:dTDP-4-dehydrorhamnose 3,5-epimerase